MVLKDRYGYLVRNVYSVERENLKDFQMEMSQKVSWQVLGEYICSYKKGVWFVLELIMSQFYLSEFWEFEFCFF